MQALFIGSVYLLVFSMNYFLCECFMIKFSKAKPWSAKKQTDGHCSNNLIPLTFYKLFQQYT